MQSSPGQHGAAAAAAADWLRRPLLLLRQRRHIAWVWSLMQQQLHWQQPQSSPLHSSSNRHQPGLRLQLLLLVVQTVGPGAGVGEDLVVVVAGARPGGGAAQGTHQGGNPSSRGIQEQQHLQERYGHQQCPHLAAMTFHPCRDDHGQHASACKGCGSRRRQTRAHKTGATASSAASVLLLVFTRTGQGVADGKMGAAQSRLRTRHAGAGYEMKTWMPCWVEMMMMTMMIVTVMMIERWYGWMMASCISIHLQVVYHVF